MKYVLTEQQMLRLLHVVGQAGAQGSVISDKSHVKLALSWVSLEHCAQDKEEDQDDRCRYCGAVGRCGC